MSKNQTFNSRIRLLVAKSYKAERLYNSLRSDFSFQSPETLNKIISSTGIGEIANDIRAREWQRCHNDLRVALNRILSDSPLHGSQMSSATRASSQQRALAGLLAEFRECYDTERKFVDQSIDTLMEASRREEFGHVLRLSLELIRSKSRAQAAKAVSDELNSVLQMSGASAIKEQGVPASIERLDTEDESLPEIEPLPANVIPLRRRVG